MDNERLLKVIKADIESGMTYKEVMKKHGLKSNYLIKRAMNKKTGSEKEYTEKYKHQYKAMRHDYKNFAKCRKDFYYLFKLFLKTNQQLNIIKRVLDINAKVEFENAQDVWDYLEKQGGQKTHA